MSLHEELRLLFQGFAAVLAVRRIFPRGSISIPPTSRASRGISRHERCRVTVRSQAEMNEIKHRRCAGDPPEFSGILRSRGLEIGNLNWHGVDLPAGQRGMLE